MKKNKIKLSLFFCVYLSTDQNIFFHKIWRQMFKTYHCAPHQKFNGRSLNNSFIWLISTVYKELIWRHTLVLHYVVVSMLQGHTLKALFLLKGEWNRRFMCIRDIKKRNIVNLYIYTCNVIARHLPIISLPIFQIFSRHKYTFIKTIDIWCILSYNSKYVNKLFSI